MNATPFDELPMVSLRKFVAAAFLLSCNIGYSAQIAVEMVLDRLPVHAAGDQTVFATPVDYKNGSVITVHVESGDSGGRDGVNLHTVVRKGTRQQDASWHWESHVIESRTMLDTWHTQASIAFDKMGYVHVAYNMHNFPWQYAVSRRPYDISEFVFKGQAISQVEIDTAKFENRTSFPDIGTASIPGNQITYPMFFKDRAGELYVTYRFAVKPARPWRQRAFGAGIARYDTIKSVWSAIGGTVKLTDQDAKPLPGQSAIEQKPFAYQDGFTVYLPTLAFDTSNGMHVFWNWRLGEAGAETHRPSYTYSPDGRRFFDPSGKVLSLPIDFAHSPPITGQDDVARYYAPKSAAISAEGIPIVVMQPLGVGRQIWAFDNAAHRFTKEDSPNAASAILVDQQGRQWAFATGLNVFMRPNAKSRWDKVGEIGTNLCYPKVAYISSESRFIVHAKSCTNDTATIVTFRR